jgi:hypothetical protein
MMPDFSDMTSAELEAASFALKGEIAVLHQQRLAVQEALSLRAAQDRADAIVEGMSDDERAALVQALGGAGGIPSEESVSVPGHTRGA